ncbi:MAG TPA: iron-sulfur cluster repair di-iron protein [Vicinamibacterales bacterium]|nr:iron-sulfur cluster repair di-iron protein [Vicinamibacterales bacterium]
MTATTATTIRDIVADDFRAAAVFERRGIDFCCRGDRSVEEACRESGLDPAGVMEELDAACAADQPGAPRFSAWDPPALVSYIVANHHTYVREAIATLTAHTAKIATVHGERHPELLEIARIFESVAEEMTSHMFKEEQILFPFIIAMDAAQQQGRPSPQAPFGTVGNPIQMMEMEHESAGGAMARIRELTGGYAPPDDACATYRVCLQELQAFEVDLHTHVHLENNILFPKAVRLENGLL